MPHYSTLIPLMGHHSTLIPCIQHHSTLISLTGHNSSLIPCMQCHSTLMLPRFSPAIQPSRRCLSLCVFIRLIIGQAVCTSDISWTRLACVAKWGGVIFVWMNLHHQILLQPFGPFSCFDLCCIVFSCLCVFLHITDCVRICFQARMDRTDRLMQQGR